MRMMSQAAGGWVKWVLPRLGICDAKCRSFYSEKRNDCGFPQGIFGLSPLRFAAHQILDILGVQQLKFAIDNDLLTPPAALRVPPGFQE